MGHLFCVDWYHKIHSCGFANLVADAEFGGGVGKKSETLTAAGHRAQTFRRTEIIHWAKSCANVLAIERWRPHPPISFGNIFFEFFSKVGETKKFSHKNTKSAGVVLSFEIADFHWHRVMRTCLLRRMVYPKPLLLFEKVLFHGLNRRIFRSKNELWPTFSTNRFEWLRITLSAVCEVSLAQFTGALTTGTCTRWSWVKTQVEPKFTYFSRIFIKLFLGICTGSD